MVQWEKETFSFLPTPTQSWLGSKENLRQIRTEMLSGKKIIENVIGRESWSLFAEQGAVAILCVNMFFENAFLFKEHNCFC